MNCPDESEIARMVVLPKKRSLNWLVIEREAEFVAPASDWARVVVPKMMELHPKLDLLVVFYKCESVRSFCFQSNLITFRWSLLSTWTKRPLLQSNVVHSRLARSTMSSTSTVSREPTSHGRRTLWIRCGLGWASMCTQSHANGDMTPRNSNDWNQFYPCGRNKVTC